MLTSTVMPITAIVSDIHGNLPALRAVLADARNRGAERYWCLGDVVGYGAQPVECLELLADLDAVIIRGNHEQAVLSGPFGFNPLAAAAIEWSRMQLHAQPRYWEFVESFPERVDTDSAVLVHGSPAQPVDEYLFREETLDHLPHGRDFSPKLARCFRLIDKPCFVGHTHIPGAINGDMTWTAPDECDDQYDTAELPCIVNVGSVGQPRDGNVDASYVLFDGRRVVFRRIAYDVQAAAALILGEPMLPDPLGQRLLEGW